MTGYAGRRRLAIALDLPARAVRNAPVISDALHQGAIARAATELRLGRAPKRQALARPLREGQRDQSVQRMRPLVESRHEH